MDNIYKNITLYFIIILIAIGFYYSVDSYSKKSIKLQKNLLITQAQTHFNSQINIRRWNAEYGGVYVAPKEGQKPNMYLNNNTLKADNNLTLFKINPALMTRELSELSEKANIKNFHFKITSLAPLNPENKATPFEQKALEYFKSSNEKEYYELSDNNKFKYMGALLTTKSCLQCHQEKSYIVGGIIGGISISLDSSNYQMIKNSIEEKTLLIKILITIFLMFTTFLIHRLLKHTQNLEVVVQKRTKELLSTKILLQKILDNDKKILLVSDGVSVIFANKTVLDLVNCRTFKEFKDKSKHISNIFEKTNNPDFLQTYNKGLHWIPYLQKEQYHKDLKVLIIKNNNKIFFKPQLKDMRIDNKLLYLIVFTDITENYLKRKDLNIEASKDPLTGFFSRKKLNFILSKEMELSAETFSKLSIIFLDIDHFKIINDTFGHTARDDILIELSEIITKIIRKSDFISRWGGEKFMITLQATNLNQAIDLAQKLRVAVEKFIFKDVKKMTISLGVIEFNFIEDQSTLIKRVDEALYEAKESGRNIVVAK
ncbi:MAG: diguanylate cyclase [Sulfurimonas sp.]|nr:diguanylate cyclase [Sulfurimonas sp.]